VKDKEKDVKIKDHLMKMRCYGENCQNEEQNQEDIDRLKLR
jgi:hypothetical protein